MQITTTIKLLLLTLVFVGVSTIVLVFGPLDKMPRLQTSATSPDKRFHVSVWKRRLSLIPPFRVGLFVQIQNEGGQTVYENKIFEDGFWYEDFGVMYKEILFENEQIKVGPKYVPGEYFTINTQDMGSK